MAHQKGRERHSHRNWRKQIQLLPCHTPRDGCYQLGGCIGFPVSCRPCPVRAAAEAFASRSTQGAVEGYIGAIDGWLCSIRVPRKTECGRVNSFFSGHYQKYGLNVQACVDSDSRFIAVSVSFLGGMKHALAFREWALSELILCLPVGSFLVADNAYPQSVRIMTPYNRVELVGRQDRDAYNFYISQLRIRMEMAIGFLVNKWRVLKSPLTVKSNNWRKTIVTCMRLHNCCIQERSQHGRVRFAEQVREIRMANQDNEIFYPNTNTARLGRAAARFSRPQ